MYLVSDVSSVIVFSSVSATRHVLVLDCSSAVVALASSWLCL